MKLFGRKSKKPGLPPGTLLYNGEPVLEKIQIHQFLYNEAQCHEQEIEARDFDRIRQDKSIVNWININGLHDIEILKKIGDMYQISDLILEDVLNPGQRPKIEELDHAVFMVMKMIFWDKEKAEIHVEQIALYLTQNTVITFQDRPGDIFEPMRNRIRESRGRIRKAGADYLCYALLDSIVDHYFSTADELGDQIETLEEEILSNATTITLNMLHQIRKQIILLRKSAVPLREGLSELYRNENPAIKESTRPYLRDVYEHVIQNVDILETMRDVNNGLFDMYLSNVSNKTNEVMKVLTIIATIFIPITFIAGIYGMNFEWMPELAWKWSYPIIWALISIVAIGMVVYFRRKKWL